LRRLNRRGEEKEMYKTFKLKNQINSSLSKINVMCSNKGLNNKKQDPFASSFGLGNLGLANESLLIEIF